MAEDGYYLLGIEPTEPPEGSGRDWFSYRIVQGANVIRGYRRGTLARVTSEVEQIVTNLNERRVIRRGRVDLPRGKSAAAAAPPDKNAAEDS